MSDFIEDFPGDNPSRQYVRRKGLERFGEQGMNEIVHDANIRFIRDFAPKHEIHDMFTRLCLANRPWNDE